MGIERLTKDNYVTWCDQAQSVLQIKKLWQYCETEPKGALTREVQEFHKDAIAYIRMSVTPNQLRLLKGVETGYEAWNALRKAHLKDGPAHGMKLFRRLQERCPDLKNVSDHVDKFIRTPEEMATMDAETSDAVLVYMLLNTLPKSFEQFEVSILTRKETPELNVDRQRRSDGVQREASAGPDNQVWAANRFKRKNNKKGKCFNCGKSGHWISECTVQLKGRTGTQPKSFLATAFSANSKQNIARTSEWAIDSGSNTHLINCATLPQANREDRSVSGGGKWASGKSEREGKCRD